jgi:glycerol-3-phosphate acyltransferase PlsY
MIAAVAGSYLAGSIPFGLLVARARGVDIRTVGSKNIGATNVARTLGKPLGALVLLLDALKGLLPALAARHLLHLDETWVALVGLFAILGHVFPIWLRFRGGKGVATALGVFAALAPIPAAAAVGVYAVVVLLTRISSLGSLLGATTLLGTMLALRAPTAVLALGIAVWLLVVVRHRDNIRRIIRREERSVSDTGLRDPGSNS